MTITAQELRDQGISESQAATPDGQRTTFRAIADQWIDAGVPFSADNLRDDLDAAGIPTRARGGLMYGLIASGVVVQVGWVKSTHPATHHKPIALLQARRRDVGEDHIERGAE